MIHPSRLWGALFERRRSGGYEVLLLLVVIKALCDGVRSLTESDAAFRTQDVFSPQVVGIEPVGWAKWLPVELVVSQDFERLVALVVVVSGMLWLSRRSLLVAPPIAAASFGLLQCLQLSRMFNYIHQQLVTTWVLIVFALVSILYHSEFRNLLRQRRYWADRMVYPIWAGALIVSFLGFQYTYSGLFKLQTGGWNSGSGLKLQLLVTPKGSAFDPDLQGPSVARFVRNHREFATVAMTSSVVLETGAILGLSIRSLRPLWTLGLIVMHVMVILTMKIWFVPNIIVLGWLAVGPERWSDAVDWVRDFNWHQRAIPRLDGS